MMRQFNGSSPIRDAAWLISYDIAENIPSGAIAYTGQGHFTKVAEIFK